MYKIYLLGIFILYNFYKNSRVSISTIHKKITRKILKFNSYIFLPSSNARTDRHKFVENIFLTQIINLFILCGLVCMRMTNILKVIISSQENEKFCEQTIKYITIMIHDRVLKFCLRLISYTYRNIFHSLPFIC